MAQFSMKIMRLSGSLLSGNQHVDNRTARSAAGRVHFEPEGLLFFDAETGRRMMADTTP
jgi:hypothetical protein